MGVHLSPGPTHVVKAWPVYLTPIAALRRSENLCALSSTFAPSSRAAHATTCMHAMDAVTADKKAHANALMQTLVFQVLNVASPTI